MWHKKNRLLLLDFLTTHVAQKKSVATFRFFDHLCGTKKSVASRHPIFKNKLLKN